MQAFLKPCLLGKSLCRPFRENEGSVEHRPSHPTQHEGYGRCGIRAAGCRVYPLHLPLGNSHGRCPQMCRRKKCWRGMPIRKTAPRPSGRKVVVYSESIQQDCLRLSAGELKPSALFSLPPLELVVRPAKGCRGGRVGSHSLESTPGYSPERACLRGAHRGS